MRLEDLVPLRFINMTWEQKLSHVRAMRYRRHVEKPALKRHIEKDTNKKIKKVQDLLDALTPEQIKEILENEADQ